jgi:hypothetical protein
MLGGPGGAAGYTAMKGYYQLPPHDLDRRLDVIKRHLNVRSVQIRWIMDWCWQLLRLIAKVAHSFLSAEIGHGKFTPLLLPSIQRDDHVEVTRFVGQMDANEDKTASGHVLTREVISIDARRCHLVRLRLFGAYGLPEYVAVTGEVL